jgi:hypothetical protein
VRERGFGHQFVALGRGFLGALFECMETAVRSLVCTACVRVAVCAGWVYTAGFYLLVFEGAMFRRQTGLAYIRSSVGPQLPPANNEHFFSNVSLVNFP